MKKKLFTILFVISVAMFAVAGCQKDETKAEQVTTKVIVKEAPTVKAEDDGVKYKENHKEAIEKIKETSISVEQDVETETGSSKKEDSSVVAAEKESTQGVSNTTSAATSTTQKNTTSSQKAEAHTHEWIAQTKTVNHAEEGHYETRVIQEAYDEEVYAWRTLCNRCTDPTTGLPLDITGHPVEHTVIVCGGGYYADRVVVDTIHHDAVTEQVWVVDKAAWTETVTTGYQCSCGATK